MILSHCIGRVVDIILAVDLCYLACDIVSRLVAHDVAGSILVMIIVGVHFIHRVTRQPVYSHITVCEKLVTASAFDDFENTRNNALFVLFRQFQYLVSDNRGIRCEVHGPIFRLIDIYIGVELEALVADSAEVLCNGSHSTAVLRRTRRQRHINIEKQVTVTAIEIVDADIPAVEEARIDTDSE